MQVQCANSSMGDVVDIIIPDAEMYLFCFEQMLNTG